MQCPLIVHSSLDIHTDGGSQARLSRFTGANSISSADFYDNGEGPARRAGSSGVGDVSTAEIMSRLSLQVSLLKRIVLRSLKPILYLQKELQSSVRPSPINAIHCNSTVISTASTILLSRPWM